jgi:hypothetical protein
MTNTDTEEWDHRMKRAINDLNRNTSKIKQAILNNEIWKLKMDHGKPILSLIQTHIDHQTKRDLE